MQPWRPELDRLAERQGLPPGAAERLAALLELLRDDPTAPTAVRDPAEGVERHVADSLAGLGVPALRAARRIADVGAGAGLPGLPLAIALPDARVALIESASRRCAFLERAVEACAAPNAEVVCARVEEWPERGLDAVVVRAVAPLPVLAEYAAPLLRVGGALVAWKGRRDPGEEADGDAAAAILGLGAGERVPVTDVTGAEYRTLHVYLKQVETPLKFPRRPGMARKRPLSRSG
jgi:16S rRNA (guanine527-N7)-methyltransferase